MGPVSRHTALLPLLLAALLLLPGCGDSSAEGEARGATVGKRPPALAVDVVQDAGVEPAGDLAGYRGKVLVLGFWLGGCAPCLEEFPELVALHGAHAADDLEVLLINVSGNRDVVEQAMREFGVPFAMALDQLSLTATRYQVAVFPTLFVIDRAGVIRARLAGRRPGRIAASVADLLEDRAEQG